MSQTRTPEEEAAGNRRALLGCGGILLLSMLLCGGGYWSLRGIFGEPTGGVCDEPMDCAWGHYCVRSLGQMESHCRLACEHDSDCPSRSCATVWIDGESSRRSACAP